ncbi:MAG TPA: hypothetical protein PLD40_08895 [Kiritimatiellia bacterium]|jgi:DNA-binding transcriptional regulator YiaG|nr:helix-turn-helix domain-containing protein [Kiritimatiellia bacterium]OQC60392.1 MAG: hypothetical protein BWX54_00213 [Verrucomicrobia bacterium ADurb.Bin018]MBP9571653.1 helix-turn-helix domain-containing protein [Kiritimatiellia bacterium]HOD99924.1 hypothetical protein [Kiritimatiellia bacterium]HOE37153.1 hypothetical protein [Kiritimatiellia bacterium]
MKKAPVAGWVLVTSRQPVYIPETTGDGIAEIIWKDVPAWKDPKTGEIFLSGEARELLESTKARFLGILSPAQIRALRRSIKATQKGMAELLQLGEKTWTRWESGAERPSRSMNVLLCAIRDGRIGVDYLRSLVPPVVARHHPALAVPEPQIAEPAAKYRTRSKRR